MSGNELGDERIIKSKAWPLGWAVVASFCGVGLGLWLLRDAYVLADRIDEDPGYIGGIGLGAVIVSGIGGVFWSICCLPGANYLRLTREGLISKTPFQRHPLVRWTWIKMIDPADKGSLFAGVDVLFREYANAPMQTITIASSRFDMSPSEIAEIIAAWRERAVSKPSPASKHVERESA